MKKLTFGIIALAVITNPKKEMHYEVISDIVVESVIENNNIKKTPQMRNWGKLMIDADLKEFTKYNNYVLFSTTVLKGKTATIGVYVNIIAMTDKERIKQSMNKSSNKTKATKEKVSTKKNWKQNYSITSIRTGFGASSKGWKPAVLINIKNTTNRDIEKYVKIRAVFYDTKNNKEVGTVTKHIATTSKPFLSKMNKDILLYTKAYKGSPTSLRLKAKLYIENELVKDVEIDTVELI